MLLGFYRQTKYTYFNHVGIYYLSTLAGGNVCKNHDLTNNDKHPLVSERVILKYPIFGLYPVNRITNVFEDGRSKGYTMSVFIQFSIEEKSIKVNIFRNNDCSFLNESISIIVYI